MLRVNRNMRRDLRTLLKVFFVASLLFSSAAGFAEAAARNDTPSPSVSTDVIKSENDKRLYRYLVLPNQMQVLLISDPDTEKAAAALDVNVGSGEDPKDRPGLAHFLEHMLFLGTQKYPKPGEYQEYISAHSGEHNAYTSLEHTNFHFDIDPQYLEPGLDRFAQFFVAPLLDEKYVARERNAVNSEFTAKIKDESRRMWDVFGELTNPANKSARFSVGTLDTLADRGNKKVRDDLLKFYHSNYSANLMSLVVVGRETPEQLEAMVRKRFSAVSNYNITLSQRAQPLFLPGFLPKKVVMRPLQDQRVLSLSFPIPAFEHWYHVKPVAYIGYMLGHEGVGSAHSVLREKGWIESLAAGSDISNRQGASFSISVALTQEGYRHQTEVVDILYQAIAQLKKHGVEKWRYNEQGTIGDTVFRYQEKGDALEYVSVLANNLHYYPPRDVIVGMTVMDDFNENVINSFLSYLNPDNALVVLSAPDVPVNKTSTYYQTEYAVAPVEASDLQRWRTIDVNAASKVQMPPPNEYVAKNFKIKQKESGEKNTTSKLPQANDAGQPALLRETHNLHLWYKADDKFNVPKGSISLYVRSDLSTDGVSGAVLTELFVRLLNNNLNSQAYAAGLAGLEVAVSRRSRGIEIQVSGYSDKQGLLLTRVLDAVASPKFQQGDFARIKEELLRELSNRDKQPPYKQMGSQLAALISKTDFETPLLYKTASATQLANVQMFVLSWLGSLQVDALVYGNYAQSDALKFSSVIENKLYLNKAAHHAPESAFVRLPLTAQGLMYAMKVDHKDVAEIQYIQGANVSIAEQARLQFLSQLMAADFFYQLRTQQQLGYVVYGSYRQMGQVPGMLFLVQSPTHTLDNIDDSMNNFMVQYAKKLETMPAEEFEQNRAALLNNVEKNPENLGEQSAEYWSQIDLRYKKFDLKQQLASEVKAITQKDLLAYYQNMFLSKSVRKLVVVASSADQPVSDKLKQKYQPIDDVEKFKTKKEYFKLK